VDWLPKFARWLDENYDVGSRGEPVRRRIHAYPVNTPNVT
jgi:hypothetical protein